MLTSPGGFWRNSPSTSETWMGSSLQNAPLSLRALYILSSRQLYTTPNSNCTQVTQSSPPLHEQKPPSRGWKLLNTSLLTAKAMDTATNGNLPKTSGTVGVSAGFQQTPIKVTAGGLVLPVDEVGGPVHRVNDPRRFVR